LNAEVKAEYKEQHHPSLLRAVAVRATLLPVLDAPTAWFIPQWQEV